jgi:hypothetical protein
MTMFMVTGDPASALRDFALPAGAEVAIVSSSPNAVKKIHRSGKKRSERFGRFMPTNRRRERRLRRPPSIGMPSSQTLGRGPSRGRSHRPGGSSHGGGAYDLEQVRMPIRGISHQAVERVRTEACSRFPVPAVGAASRHCSSIAMAQLWKA